MGSNNCRQKDRKMKRMASKLEESFREYTRVQTAPDKHWKGQAKVNKS